MKKHLNTLFVTTQGAYLAKEGETVVVKIEKEVRLRLPIHTIGIVCFGNVSCSPFLMGFCAENGVGMSFLNEHGVSGPVQGPVWYILLRREQYRRADDSVYQPFVRCLLTGGSPQPEQSSSGRFVITETRSLQMRSDSL